MVLGNSTEVGVHMCLKIKLLLKFRKLHKKTPQKGSLFNKVTVYTASYFIKERFQHRCFPMNFTKFSRTVFCKTMAADRF